MIRLNKVTRDLNVGIQTLVAFLQKKGYNTEDFGPNTKITEEQYNLLVTEFSTDKNLRLESERMFQNRHNKDRGTTATREAQAKEAPAKEAQSETKNEEEKEHTVGETIKLQVKTVGKIDLDALEGRKPTKPADESPENKAEEIPTIPQEEEIKEQNEREEDPVPAENEEEAPAEAVQDENTAEAIPEEKTEEHPAADSSAPSDTTEEIFNFGKPAPAIISPLALAYQPPFPKLKSSAFLYIVDGAYGEMNSGRGFSTIMNTLTTMM